MASGLETARRLKKGKNRETAGNGKARCKHAGHKSPALHLAFPSVSPSDFQLMQAGRGKRFPGLVRVSQAPQFKLAPLVVWNMASGLKDDTI